MELLGKLSNIDPIELKYRCFKALGYTPHRGQDKVHRSLARFRTWAAAARVGKTYAAAMEVISWIMMNPRGQVIWIVGPTYALCEKIFRVVWHNIVEKGAGKFPVVSMSERDKIIRLKNGTIIEGKSTDNPVSLLGEGVDFMVVDEASRVPSVIYDEYLMHRLTNTKGHMLKISTPKGKGSRFHQDWLLGNNPDPLYVDYESFHSTIRDNPLIPKDVIKFLFTVQAKANPESFRQEVLGEFIDFGGSVFPTYQKEVFFRDVPWVPYLPVEASLDIGVRAPTSCLYIQRDKNQVRVLKEFTRSGFSSLQNARKLKPIFEQYNVQRCVVDIREPDARMIYQEIIPSCTFVPGPPDDIAPTLNTLRLHLMIDSHTKQPRIVFDKSCKNLAFEFDVAHYPKGETELPVDKDNHSIAALRYFLHKYCNRFGFSANMLGAYGERETIASVLVNDLGSEFEHPYDHDRELNCRDWMGDDI